MKKTTSEQLEEITQQIEELEKKKAGLLNLSEEKRIAEDLHSFLCHQDHTEGCGWFYSSWELPCNTRKEYLKRALFVLDFVKKQQLQLHSVMEFIHKITTY